MPYLIPVDVADARARREVPAGTCLMCALLQGSAGVQYVLARDAHSTTVLARYARRWGHAMVVLNAHATDMLRLDDDVWTEANRAVLRVGRAIERVLKPERVYIALLGAKAPKGALTSAHLHWHVIPVTDAADRPSTVFNSEAGFYGAEPDEWEALCARVSAALPTP